MSARKRGSAPASSRRYPHALPTVPGQMATVLVALAATEPSPSQISVGKETSVPPPATELMAPARKAAAKAAADGESPMGSPTCRISRGAGAAPGERAADPLPIRPRKPAVQRGISHFSARL